MYIYTIHFRTFLNTKFLKSCNHGISYIMENFESLVHQSFIDMVARTNASFEERTTVYKTAAIYTGTNYYKYNLPQKYCPILLDVFDMTIIRHEEAHKDDASWWAKYYNPFCADTLKNTRTNLCGIMHRAITYILNAHIILLDFVKMFSDENTNIWYNELTLFTNAWWGDRFYNLIDNEYDLNFSEAPYLYATYCAFEALDAAYKYTNNAEYSTDDKWLRLYDLTHDIQNEDKYKYNYVEDLQQQILAQIRDITQ